jgi:outer membrane protein TolC
MQARHKDALEKRADVRAARLRERAAHIQVLAAEDTLKTQLDFVGSLNTNGLREGSNGAELRSVAAVSRRSISVSRCACRWRAPVARGLVTTRQSAHRQSVIRLHEAEGNVGSALVTATSALRRTLAAMRTPLLRCCATNRRSRTSMSSANSDCPR